MFRPTDPRLQPATTLEDYFPSEKGGGCLSPHQRHGELMDCLDLQKRLRQLSPPCWLTARRSNEQTLFLWRIGRLANENDQNREGRNTFILWRPIPRFWRHTAGFLTWFLCNVLRTAVTATLRVTANSAAWRRERGASLRRGTQITIWPCLKQHWEFKRQFEFWA